ncbi:MAG: C40 family peptidase [Bacteroidota bacterium]
MQIRYVALLSLLSVGLFSCNASKKARKYDYLLENRPTASRPTPSPRTPSPAIEPEEVVILEEHQNPRPAESRPEAARPVPERPVPQPNRPKSAKATGSLNRDQVSTVVQTALDYYGTPYQYGGMSRTGMDCSGLVCTAFRAINWNLPHSSQSLAQQGTPIRKHSLQPGHLVFFSAKNTQTINHMGLVTKVVHGQVYFVHATVSRGVRQDRLDDPYWKVRFRKAVML